MPAPAHRVVIASVPDRDDVVAEVWFGEAMLAELGNDIKGVVVQIYPPPDEHFWELHYDDLTQLLQSAKAKLLGTPFGGLRRSNA